MFLRGLRCCCGESHLAQSLLKKTLLREWELRTSCVTIVLKPLNPPVTSSTYAL